MSIAGTNIAKNIMTSCKIVRVLQDPSLHHNFSSFAVDSSSDYSDVDSESSCQAYETEYVRDSWEDWDPSDSASSEDEIRPSATDQQVSTKKEWNVTLGHRLGSDSGSLTAGSESNTDEVQFQDNSSPRPESQKASVWKCLVCRLPVEWPWRYCGRCYNLRKNWLPDRPKRKKKTKRGNEKVSRVECADSQGFSCLSSEVSSIPSTQESFGSNLGTSSQESSSFTSVSQTDDSVSLCSVCGMRPNDGVFLHGKTAHQMCCFRCSNKVWSKRKDCPVCRQRIENVLKVFSKVGRKSGVHPISQ